MPLFFICMLKEKILTRLVGVESVTNTVVIRYDTNGGDVLNYFYPTFLARYCCKDVEDEKLEFIEIYLNCNLGENKVVLDRQNEDELLPTLHNSTIEKFQSEFAFRVIGIKEFLDIMGYCIQQELCDYCCPPQLSNLEAVKKDLDASVKLKDELDLYGIKMKNEINKYIADLEKQVTSNV